VVSAVQTSRSRLRQALVVLLILVLLLGGIVLLLNQPKRPSAQLATTPIINPQLFPSSDLVPSPGPDLGFRVKVTELGINLPVVEGDGWTVALYKAAHYPGMKLPGQGGRSMLYAHAQAGMFGPLLHPGGKVGQHVEVDRPGLQPLRYTITQFFADWPPSDIRYLQPGDHEELILLTCTSFDPNGPRILAVAEPAG
jgi:LPXTG-site transpeptidase (sortase) family protein